MKLRAGVLVAAAVGLISPQAYAQTSVQPYIDNLRRHMPEQPAQGTESFTETERRRIETERAKDPRLPATGYTEKLKELNPELQQKPASSEGYSEGIRTRLGPGSSGGAIQAVKEGRSELQLKREGKVDEAFGFRVGAALNRNIVADSESIGSGSTFEEVYGNGWSPDFTLYYEWQPIRSATWGSLGLMTTSGFTFNTGDGRFATALPKGWAPGENFPLQSRAKVRFFTVPAMIGPVLRVNFLRWLKPYVSVAGGLTGFVETRSDTKERIKGYSRTVQVAGGAVIPMDWMSRKTAWDLYAEHAIKGYGITLDYTKMITVAGDVDFSTSGISAGMYYEF